MIHHVQLACPPGGEDASRGFYVGVLGFTEVPKPPALASRGGAWFRRSGHAGVPVEVHLGVEDGFRPARKAHPAFLLDSLDEVAGRLVAAGYPVHRGGEEFPGLRRFHTEDVHGNRLELLAPVS